MQPFYDTPAGAFAVPAVAVAALTQAAKRYWPFDPKWLALLFALLAAFGAQAARGEFAAADWMASAAGALITAGAAVGVFEGAKGLAGRGPGAEKGETP